MMIESGNLTDMPTQTLVEITVATNDLNAEFDKEWELIKNNLHPDIVKKAKKGGYRTIKKDRVINVIGGKHVLFRNVLTKMIGKFVPTSQQYSNKYVLEFDDVTLEQRNDRTMVRALVYLEPTITWHKVPGLDFPVTVEVSKQDDSLVDKLVNDEVNSMLDSKSELQDTNAPAKFGDTVFVDCHSVLDNKEWPNGTFNNAEWLVSKEKFSVPEIIDGLIGMNVGDQKLLSFTLNNKQFNEFDGKNVSSIVKVLRVCTKIQPKLDDEFAKIYGKSNVDELKSQINDGYKTVLESRRKNLIMSKIDGIVSDESVVSVSQVPHNWIVKKTHMVYVNKLNELKSDEETLKYFQRMLGNVITKDDVLYHLSQIIQKEFTVDLVYRSWGMLNKIDGDVSIDNISNYADAVRKHMLSITAIKET